MTQTLSFQFPRFTRPQLLAAARHFSHLKGTALLYSGGDLESARYSYLFLYPYVTHEVTDRAAPWEQLKELICFEQTAPPRPRYVGFLSYEMGATSHPDIRVPSFGGETPLACFQRCAVTLMVNHMADTATVWIDQQHLPDGAPDLDHPQGWTAIIGRTDQTNNISIGSWSLSHSSETRDSYIRKVEEAKELIRAGEIYQVNLSQQFTLTGHGDPYAVFESLALLNPAPFSVYINCGDYCIVSSSPERLLECSQGHLETRPIKGTIARGKNPIQDIVNRQRLLTSEKDRAELLMITDIMRNDLGRISTVGSVVVDELWRCEAYTNVYHLLSVIRSKADPSVHPIDRLRYCFPGGSITGCPKVRSMEVIYDLEKAPRGIYTGSIGCFMNNGDFDFNIAIRTLVMWPDRAIFRVGGAIVYDSDPISEFNETLHKGASIFQVMGVQS